MTVFLAQGGYAFFVWTATGVSVAALGLMTWLTLASYGRARRHLADLEARRVQDSETNL